MQRRLRTHRKRQAKHAALKCPPVFFCGPRASSLSTTCNTDVLKANTPADTTQNIYITKPFPSAVCLTFVAADERPSVLVGCAYQGAATIPSNFAYFDFSQLLKVKVLFVEGKTPHIICKSAKLSCPTETSFSGGSAIAQNIFYFKRTCIYQTNHVDMAKGRIRAKSTKGNRWKKGESSSSNPKTNKHRLAARGKFDSQLGEVNCTAEPSLTAEALAVHALEQENDPQLNRHDLCEIAAPSLFIVWISIASAIEDDREDGSQTATSAHTSSAYSSIEAAHPLFGRVKTLWNSSLESHREVRSYGAM